MPCHRVQATRSTAYLCIVLQRLQEGEAAQAGSQVSALQLASLLSMPAHQPGARWQVYCNRLTCWQLEAQKMLDRQYVVNTWQIALA